MAARLSRYLQVLTQAKKMGRETISSQEIAEYTHINSTQIRRDLSGFGKFGKRGVGYNVDSLVVADPQDPADLRPAQHRRCSAPGTWARRSPARDIFADHGFRIVAIFDTTPRRSGHRWATSTVRAYPDLAAGRPRARTSWWASSPCPTARPRSVADELVMRGQDHLQLLRGAPEVPPEVTVHTSSPAVDLLYALYFYLT